MQAAEIKTVDFNIAEVYFPPRYADPEIGRAELLYAFDYQWLDPFVHVVLSWSP